MRTTKKIFLMLCALFIVGYSLADAQEANYSGTWVLDKSKSTLQGRMAESIVSVTLVITQKAKDFKAEFQYKYQERDFTDIVALIIGGEQVEREGRGGRGTVKSKAQWSEDKKSLIIISESTFSSDRGTFSSKTTEKYSLSEGGKILTIDSERESQRGTRTSKMVFTKK